MHKSKILIVEDEKSLLKAWVERFKQQGFEVLASVSGSDATKLALKEHPDMVIIDLVMPSSDGLTMIKKLREDKWGNRVPVMFLNSWQDHETLASANGTSYHYGYNWSVQQVVEKVKTKLGLRQLSPQARI